MDRLHATSPRAHAAVGLCIGLLGPAVVTWVAAIPENPGTAVPALLYLLAVAAAVVVGGLWPGVIAAFVSFAGLDFFFTPPLHTFAVGKTEGLIALGVFLVVALVVSAAFSSEMTQREAAEIRERQVRALYRMTSRLLSSAGLDRVLQEVTESITNLFGVRACRVVVVEPSGGEHELAVSGAARGPVITVPLSVDRRLVGRIEMFGAGHVGLTEMEVLDTFAGQLALGLERARLGEEARGARVDAEVSRSRAALFSSVTHDLRTPLASITASASSLLEEGVAFSEEQRLGLLRTILEESERLNRLVANLLDIAQLRAGGLVPHPELVPLEDIVSSVMDRLRTPMSGRQVRVLIRPDIPPVQVDVVQMDQVFTNLLENAIRYSPTGSAVTVSAWRWGETVEIRVADRGPGIPPENRSQVFEEFYREDVGGRRSGSGLGLAIARAVVTAHHGSMWVEDTPGGGTTVGLRLPLAAAPTGKRTKEKGPG